MARRGVVRAPARRANACGRSRSRRSRPERREGGTHERPEPRGPGRYPGFTRIETPASGATHSIGGDCGGERSDVAAGRTTPRPTRELRLRHGANAMRAGRSRQAVRHRGWGGCYRTSNHSPSVLSTQPLAGAIRVQTIRLGVKTPRLGSDSVRTNCTHADSGTDRSINRSGSRRYIGVNTPKDG